MAPGGLIITLPRKIGRGPRGAVATWGPGGVGLAGTWGEGGAVCPELLCSRGAGCLKDPAGVGGGGAELETQGSQSSSLFEAQQPPRSSGNRASTPSPGWKRPDPPPIPAPVQGPDRDRDGSVPPKFITGSPPLGPLQTHTLLFDADPHPWPEHPGRRGTEKGSTEKHTHSAERVCAQGRAPGGAAHGQILALLAVAAAFRATRRRHNLGRQVGGGGDRSLHERGPGQRGAPQHRTAPHAQSQGGQKATGCEGSPGWAEPSEGPLEGQGVGGAKSHLQEEKRGTRDRLRRPQRAKRLRESEGERAGWGRAGVGGELGWGEKESRPDLQRKQQRAGRGVRGSGEDRQSQGRSSGLALRGG